MVWNANYVSIGCRILKAEVMLTVGVVRTSYTLTGPSTTHHGHTLGNVHVSFGGDVHF